MSDRAIHRSVEERVGRQKMTNVPKEVRDRAGRATADTRIYNLCMTVIKARIFTIQKLLNNEIHIPLLMLKD
jgi:hypothetical protein